MVNECSEQSLYQRFFKAVNASKLTERKVVNWTHYDRKDEIAVAAVQQCDKATELGVVRLVRVSPETAEFSVLVVDHWQRKGLGFKLTEKAIEVCQRNGIRFLQGRVLNINQPMFKICQRLGFKVSPVMDEGLCEISLDLNL